MKNLEIFVGLEKSSEALYGEHLFLTTIEINGQTIYKYETGEKISFGSDVSGVSFNVGLHKFKDLVQKKGGGSNPPNQPDPDGRVKPGGDHLKETNSSGF